MNIFLFFFPHNCVLSADNSQNSVASNDNMASHGGNSPIEVVQHSGGIKYHYDYDKENLSIVKAVGQSGKFITKIFRKNRKKYQISVWVHHPNLNVLKTFCLSRFQCQPQHHARNRIISNIMSNTMLDTICMYNSNIT